MQEILFVCTGNTCRSPMAEVIANDLFKKNNLPYRAFSRGVNVIVPSRASVNAVKAVKSLYMLELYTHISRQIKEEDIIKADKIFVMTKNHKDYFEEVYGQYKDKIHTMYELIADEKDIKDPYGGNIRMYEACAKELEYVINKTFVE